MTRAGERLFITRSARRTVHGSDREMQPSRFIAEIPAACLREETRGQKKGRRGEARQSRDQLPLFG